MLQAGFTVLSFTGLVGKCQAKCHLQDIDYSSRDDFSMSSWYCSLSFYFNQQWTLELYDVFTAVVHMYLLSHLQENLLVVMKASMSRD